MIVGLVLILLLLVIVFKKYTHWDFGNDEPFLVNVWNYCVVFTRLMTGTNENRLDRYIAIGKKFPKYVRCTTFGIDNFFVHDPEIMRKIFLAPNACARPSGHIFQTPYSLMAARYQYWKKARKEINPAFSSNVIKNFFPVFFTEASKIVKKIEDVYPNGKEFNLQLTIEEMVINAIAITVFDLRDKLSLAREMKGPIDELMGIMNKRLFNILMHNKNFFNLTNDSLKFDKIMKGLYDFTADALRESIERREACKNIDENFNEEFRPKVEFFIDIMINNKSFSHEELLEHLGFFIVAATDTSTTLMTSTLLYLAMFPEYQDKVYEEIRDNFNDDCTEVTLDLLQRLVFLEQCLNESLRIFPPVAHTMRTIVNYPLDVGIKKPLRKRSQIHFMNYLLHHRKDIWGEDAEEYKPERFSPENTEKRHPYAFVPFGHGARMCIGWKYAMYSAKIELMTLLRAYKFKTKMTMKDMLPVVCISTRFVNPPMVWVEKRQ